MGEKSHFYLLHTHTPKRPPLRCNGKRRRAILENGTTKSLIVASWTDRDVALSQSQRSEMVSLNGILKEREDEEKEKKKEKEEERKILKGFNINVIK